MDKELKKPENITVSFVEPIKLGLPYEWKRFLIN